MKNENFITYTIRDTFTGWTRNEAIYAWSLILLQIAVYIWNPDSLLGFITGLTGTACVILAAKRKISNYAFGFIQTAVALYLGLTVRLWGESAENLFYFISQFIGYIAWRKHMVAVDAPASEAVKMEDAHLEQVETRKFKMSTWILSVVAIAVGTLVAGFIFDKMAGTQPYIDAFTLVTAIIAQIIMLARYREQWTFWFLLNIVSIYQWFTLGNMSMVALYVAFIINNAYGYYQWTKGATEN